MDLGTAKLRKVGINNLHCAVHPRHGVLWTDGKGIYLAPIQLEGNQVQNATSVKLGEFENVVSIHWSCVRDSDSCHMSVVHQQSVTVWRVSGILPKLSFKQVRKINVKPIYQGCLWNPVSDVLSLLSRQQCSFYFRHDSNKGSYAFPSLENGRIECGCWSPDGSKLILCVGATLLIYRWTDVRVSLSEFTASAWRIPALVGQVISISPMQKDMVVVATEIPLENLCRQQQDMFVLPAVNGDDVHSKDDLIRPNKAASATQSLLNLQPTSPATADAGSSLTLIHFNDGTSDPSKLSSVPLKGILTPDILLYESSSQCVVVGSNSQSQLHIYALLDKHLAYCGDIQLDKGQRPKGLCSMPTYFDDHGAALLILVGQRPMEDGRFLSSSPEAEFMLSLKYIILKAGYDGRSRRSGPGDGIKTKSRTRLKNANLTKSESMKEHRLKTPSESQMRIRGGSVHGDHQALSTSTSIEEDNTAPVTDSVQLIAKPTDLPTKHHRKMIEDMSDSSDTPIPEDAEVEATSFSQHKPSFQNHKLLEQYDIQPASRPKSKALKEGSPKSQRSPSKANATSIEASHGGRPKKDLARKYEDAMPKDSSHDLQQAAAEIYPQSERTWKTESIEDVTYSKGSRPVDHSSDQESKDIFTSRNAVSQVESSSDSLRLQSNASPFGQLPRITETRLEMAEVDGPLHQQEIDDPGKEETMSDRGLGSSMHSADSSFDSVEKQVKIQRDSIGALQRRLEDLSIMVQETCCVFPTKYQDMDKPELLEIFCEKPEGTETKKFLLDSGRLQLESVKAAFDLSTVELWLDGIPCVIGANIDGYIPMKFSPSSMLHISGLSRKSDHTSSVV